MCMFYLSNPNPSSGVDGWRAELETDYHVSPILAPSALLSQFPPVLIQCGQRDPLVDDTMLFAARLREAKRTSSTRKGVAGTIRKQDTHVLSVSTCSTPTPLPSPPASVSESGEDEDSGDEERRTEAPRSGPALPNVEHGEDSDVFVQIFPDWSHGYLQMSTILPGATTAIYDMADWMCRRFSSDAAAI